MGWVCCWLRIGGGYTGTLCCNKAIMPKKTHSKILCRYFVVLYVYFII